MKKTGLIILALLFLIIQVTLAQDKPINLTSQCFTQENTVSTNWNCYHTDPNNLDYFPNDFNWTKEFFKVVLPRRAGQTEPAYESIRSPFFPEGERNDLVRGFFMDMLTTLIPPTEGLRA